MRSKVFLIVGLVMIASMIVTACAAPEAPTPETITIIETVEVEVEGETVVQEVERVVTATPAPVVEEEEVEVVFESADPTTWVYVTFGDVDTLDTGFMYDSASGDAVVNLYDWLVTFDGDNGGEFVPALASSWDVSDDGTVYTFHIREGVQFHDGTILQPSDVSYTFIRNLLQGGTDSPQFMLTEPILGVGAHDIVEFVDAENPPYDDAETLATYPEEDIVAACELVQSKIVADNDAMTVTFNLEQGWGAFIATLSGYWGSVRSEAWTKANGGWDGDCTTWPQYYAFVAADLNELGVGNDAMGTGPYMLDHWTPTEGYVLVANENYWVTEPLFEGGPTGAPSLKTVVVMIVDEFNTRWAMQQAGDADQIEPGSQENWPILDNFVGEYCTVNNKPENCGAFEDHLMDDPAMFLRRIDNIPTSGRTDVYFTWEVNTEGGNNYIGSGELDGNGIPPDFMSDVHIRKAFNYCFDFEAYLNDVMQGEGERSLGVMLPGMIGYPEDESFTYNYDLAKCEEEFKASSWVAEDGTHLWDLGFRFTLAYNTGNQTRQSISQIIQAGLSAVNPNFVGEVTALPWPAFLASIRASQIPVFLIGWGSDFHDTHNWAPIFTNAYYGRRQNLPQELMDAYAEINARAGVASAEERQVIYMEEFNPLYYETVHGLTLFAPYGRRYEPRYVVGGEFNPLKDQVYYEWTKK
jgi:peptide/nickel transport system substrate-binding protein